MSVQHTLGIDHSFTSSTVFRRCFDPLPIGLSIDEMKRIRGPQVGVEFSVLSLIKEHLEAIVCPQFEVVITLGTDGQILFQLLFPDDVAAVITLGENTFGPNPTLSFRRGLEWSLLSFEPRHGKPIIEQANCFEQLSFNRTPTSRHSSLATEALRVTTSAVSLLQNRGINRMTKRRTLSKTEWKIMNICWRLGKATARQVYEETLKDQQRDYRTVKTLLDRTAAKGYLETSKLGPLVLYAPAVARRTSFSSAIGEFVENVLDHSVAPLYLHLADQGELDEEEKEALRTLLDRLGEEEEAGR